ncbi:MAG: hypothetical protein WCI05_10580 [Myxococcales bacterium]
MRGLTLLLVVGGLSCGYHSVRQEGLHYGLGLVRSNVADPVVADEVVAGLREGLLRGGAALGNADGFPRVEVEVLWAGDTSVSIMSNASGTRARALEVSASGRAWIVLEKGGVPTSDTGDMRVVAMGAPQETLQSEGTVQAGRLRALGRRLGNKLAARLLGAFGPRDE